MTHYDIDKQGQPRYFHFEADFVEDNIRCIPMIVRFKLDACGIKLKLAQWSRFTEEERHALSDMPCATAMQVQAYSEFLHALIVSRTGHAATMLEVDNQPAWADAERILPDLQQQARLAGTEISLSQWKSLHLLQRFALLKLCRPGHENRNFPIAMREFGLLNQRG